MGLVRLLAMVGFACLLLAGGLVWIFAEPYVIAGVVIYILWRAYKRSEEREKNGQNRGDGAQ